MISSSKNVLKTRFYSRHGHYILLLLNGQRNAIRDSLTMEVTTEIIGGQRWVGTAVIPGEYFPPQVRTIAWCCRILLNVCKVCVLGLNERESCVHCEAGKTTR